jgi:hypothetical protein
MSFLQCLLLSANGAYRLTDRKRFAPQVEKLLNSADNETFAGEMKLCEYWQAQFLCAFWVKLFEDVEDRVCSSENCLSSAIRSDHPLFS